MVMIEDSLTDSLWGLDYIFLAPVLLESSKITCTSRTFIEKIYTLQYISQAILEQRINSVELKRLGWK